MMDILQRLGGRKFLMSLIVIGVGIALDIKAPNGLSATMAGFLVSLVGMFSVANNAASKAYMASKTAGGAGDQVLHKKMDAMADMIQATNSPENMETLIKLLSDLNTGVSQVKQVTGQNAEAVIKHTQMLQGMRQRSIE
jgi:hypothetical protein